MWRTIEEGVTTELSLERQRRNARIKTIRKGAKLLRTASVACAILAAVMHTCMHQLDVQMQKRLAKDMCGGLEYLHPRLVHVPVVYFTNSTPIWFPSYTYNVNSTKIRSIEQSVVCSAKTSRLRHTDVRVRGLWRKETPMTGRLAACAAHRIDFYKFNNCSF